MDIQAKIENGKAYLKEQFDNCGDSPWLEGWICGFTDPYHKNDGDDEVHEALMNYIINDLRG